MQILVVVANTQVRRLRTEVEKASVWTALVHGSGGPNPLGSHRGCKVGCPAGVGVASAAQCLRWRPVRGRGSRTNIPAPAEGERSGDATIDPGDQLGRALEEFSFLLHEVDSP